MFKHFRAKCNASAANQHLPDVGLHSDSVYRWVSQGQQDWRLLSPSHHRPCVHLQAECRKGRLGAHPPHSPGFPESLWKAPLGLLGVHLTLTSVSLLLLRLLKTAVSSPVGMKYKLSDKSITRCSCSRLPTGAWRTAGSRQALSKARVHRDGRKHGLPLSQGMLAQLYQ